MSANALCFAITLYTHLANGKVTRFSNPQGALKKGAPAAAGRNHSAAGLAVEHKVQAAEQASSLKAGLRPGILSDNGSV